jgi:hypothetical protein
MPNGSTRGKGLFDHFISDQDSLPNGFEPARETPALHPFPPGTGGFGFFQDETHFGDWADTAVKVLGGPVLCHRHGDTPDQVGSDHSAPEIRDEFINLIEESAG